MPEEYPKRVIRGDVVFTATAAAYDDLEFPIVPNGEQHFIRNVVATDEDGQLTKIGAFIRTKGDDYWLEERAFTTAALRRRLPVSAWLREGERLIVRITGSSKGHTLRAWITGEYEEIGELVGAPTRYGEL